MLEGDSTIYFGHARHGGMADAIAELCPDARYNAQRIGVAAFPDR
ncbi:MAG: hypothetical protein R3F36_12750 [Candidatus Competibacteraceae bacterium]